MTHCTGCSNTWKLEISRIHLTIDSHQYHNILASSASLNFPIGWKRLLAGRRNPGHDQNTGSELHSNYWPLPGCREDCGGNSLWWNGDGSSADIMWILSTCQPTKSVWSIPPSTRRCTEAILQEAGCLSRSENVEVCAAQSGWTIGMRIPSFTRTKDSYNPCCNRGSAVLGWKGYYIKTKAISGAPE